MCVWPSSLPECTWEQWCYCFFKKLVAIRVLPVSHYISRLTPGRPYFQLFLSSWCRRSSATPIIAVFLNISAGVKHEMFCTDKNEESRQEGAHKSTTRDGFPSASHLNWPKTLSSSPCCKVIFQDWVSHAELYLLCQTSKNTSHFLKNDYLEYRNFFLLPKLKWKQTLWASSPHL